MSPKTQLLSVLIFMQILMAISSAVVKGKGVKGGLVVTESAEAIRKSVQGGRLRSDVDVTQEEEDENDEDFKSVLDVRSSLGNNEEQPLGGSHHFQWKLIELLKPTGHENSGNVLTESSEPVLRCYNCTYYTYLDNSTELSSDEQCRLEPGEESGTNASKVTFGLTPYCAITTFSNSSVTAVMRTVVQDHPDLSGRCKDVPGMKICYCSSDFCNGPARNDSNSISAAEDSSEFNITAPDDPLFKESPANHLNCNDTYMCSHSSSVPITPPLIPVLITVLYSTLNNLV